MLKRKRAAPRCRRRGEEVARGVGDTYTRYASPILRILSRHIRIHWGIYTYATANVQRKRQRDRQGPGAEGREGGRNRPSERRYDKREVFSESVFAQPRSMVVAAMLHAVAAVVVVVAAAVAAVRRLPS